MILLLSFSVSLFICSCQSEYQHQMSKARELVRQEVQVKQSMKHDFSVESARALTQLRHEIGFHAHLSGNESVFLQELNAYRSGLTKKEQHVHRVLISKYP